MYTFYIHWTTLKIFPWDAQKTCPHAVLCFCYVPLFENHIWMLSHSSDHLMMWMCECGRTYTVCAWICVCVCQTFVFYTHTHITASIQQQKNNKRNPDRINGKECFHPNCTYLYEYSRYIYLLSGMCVI